MTDIQDEKYTFNYIFINLASNLAQKSHCVKKKVGAVLTKNNQILSIGYNTTLHKCDEKWPNVGCPLTLTGGCSLAIHAEENVIKYFLQNYNNISNATLYTTLSPCIPCAKLIITAKISRVIYLELYANYKKLEIDEGVKFLIENGIEIFKYNN
jgi:dCMP deaminase